MGCNLCNVYTKNRQNETIHYEDNEIVVTDAKTKKGHKERLMLIVKDHTKEISQQKESEYIRKFIDIAQPRFAWAEEFFVFGWNFEIKPPAISDHWHKIASDKDPSAEDFQELFGSSRTDLIRIKGASTSESIT